MDSKNKSSTCKINFSLRMSYSESEKLDWEAPSDFSFEHLIDYIRLRSLGKKQDDHN